MDVVRTKSVRDVHGKRCQPLAQSNDRERGVDVSPVLFERKTTPCLCLLGNLFPKEKTKKGVLPRELWWKKHREEEYRDIIIVDFRRRSSRVKIGVSTHKKGGRVSKW